jgi:peptidoglycan/xylan/chitin deacetylase (PgdA/CDA1 family)
MALHRFSAAVDQAAQPRSRFVKTLFAALLARSPLQAYFLGPGSRRGVVVLAYHGVDDPRRFEAQIQWLVRRMRPVSIADAFGPTARAASLRRPVVVTFDDGQRSVVEHGLPILERHRVPAAVFVIAGLLDRDRPPWWVEVRELCRNGGRAAGFESASPDALTLALKRVPNQRRLAIIDELRRTSTAPAPPLPQLEAAELPMLERRGVTIGNHTLSHPCLDRCEGETIEREIVAAHERLTTALGHPPRTFAYPNGDYDPRAVEALRDLEYETAFLFDHRRSPPVPPDPFRISRVRVSSDADLDRFRILASGLHSALFRIVTRRRAPAA